MATFDMVVVGCGGGPSETNLSSYLLKPSNQAWQDGLIALEAGSGIGALKRIMNQNPNVFDPSASVMDGVAHTRESRRPQTAAELYSYIRGFLITHAHLDHVSGLILSAGALSGARRRIWATNEALKDLEKGVFSDRLWPNLASWKQNDPPFKFLYSALPLDQYHSIGCNISVRTMAVSHGTNESGTYNSAAFFLRHDPSQKECLFWGDVEPDSIASKPANIFVWREAAPKIVAGKLDSVFIECSWPSGRSDETLFGHLTPEHLTQELRVLATEVYAVNHNTVDYGNGQVRRSSRRPSIPAFLARKGKRETSVAALEKTRGVLEGVKIFVIHCKDDLEEKFSEPINQIIAGQIRALVDEAGLGCEIIAVEQGTRISI